MNKRILTLSTALLLFWGVMACDEPPKGPLVNDGTAPGVISNPRVKNMPGGAEITYDIPKDADALYVEGRYKRNGKTVVARSSVHKNTLTIEGLSSTEPQEIELITVDRSENRSAAVKVTVNPLESHLNQMFKSFELMPDFGGPRLNYKNEGEIKTEIRLYTVDEQGKETYKQSAFLNGKEVNQFYTFRDTAFNEKPLNFALHALDRWGNKTDTKKETVKSIKEDLMDRTKMKTVELTGDSKDAWGWVLKNVFDGNKNTGFHTAASAGDGPIVPPYTKGNHMFTVDMGVVAKLSRIKWWQRPTNVWVFRHGNPRYYEIWGIDRLPGDDGASMAPGSGWVRLVKDAEVEKPSGRPPQNNTAEDLAHAVKGEEELVPVEAPPVRYIRFVCLENWARSKFVHIMEYEFYGKVEREIK